MTKEQSPARNVSFPPSRAAGLARLHAFAPRAGLAYARDRNRDLPGHPHVSTLSPYLRHRLLTEPEVLNLVARQHGDAAEKFLAEVLWRTYWKGFLELRPGLWDGYRQGVQAALNRIATEAGLRRRWEDACAGQTGIEGFDHWARELVETGYLHNHARMWFASIWIFTLRLPWELGADFFLRHLLDGDPASNTLSWRWVAGLHTPGKTYAATAENIAKNTGGRFRPKGLATQIHPVAGQPNPAPGPGPMGDIPSLSQPTILLIHEDDLSPEWLLDNGLRPVALATFSDCAARSPLQVAPALTGFVRAAMDDCQNRLVARLGPDVPVMDLSELGPGLRRMAEKTGARQIVTPYAPIGPMSEAIADARKGLELAGLSLCQVLREHDRRLWPLATHGFFRFRAAAGQPPF